MKFSSGERLRWVIPGHPVDLVTYFKRYPSAGLHWVRDVAGNARLAREDHLRRVDRYDLDFVE